jgi:hypothetical protein
MKTIEKPALFTMLLQPPACSGASSLSRSNGLYMPFPESTSNGSFFWSPSLGKGEKKKKKKKTKKVNRLSILQQPSKDVLTCQLEQSVQPFSPIEKFRLLEKRKINFIQEVRARFRDRKIHQTSPDNSQMLIFPLPPTTRLSFHVHTV